MDNSKQQEKMGEIDRLLQEKAKKGFEFGKSSQEAAKEAEVAEKDTVHIGQPKSNNTGIDRGRWAD